MPEIQDGKIVRTDKEDKAKTAKDALKALKVKKLKDAAELRGAMALILDVLGIECDET